VHSLEGAELKPFTEQHKRVLKGSRETVESYEKGEHMPGWPSLTRGTRFHILFFSTVILLGASCFLFARFGASPEARQFVLGMGIALIPAGLIGLIHRLFFFDELRAEMDEILRVSLSDAVKSDLLPFLESGIIRVSRDRAEMMEHFKGYISQEAREVIIIGSSLRGILDPDEEVESKKAFADLIRQRLSAGVSFKFLLTHPALAFLREDAEGRAPGDIKQEIIATLRYLTQERGGQDERPGLGVTHQNIKLYKGTPTIFSIVTSSHLFMNPYTYQSNAFESFCIEIRRAGTNDLYSRFINDHFHKPWKNEPRTTETLDLQMLKRLEGMTLVDIFEERAAEIGRSETGPSGAGKKHVSQLHVKHRESE